MYDMSFGRWMVKLPGTLLSNEKKKEQIIKTQQPDSNSRELH